MFALCIFLSLWKPVHPLRLFIAAAICLMANVYTADALENAWLGSINTINDFNLLSLEDHSRSDLLRVTKFLIPARQDPALLPSVFQNVNLYRLHLEFMVNEFPERFGGLTSTEYMELVFSATRTYYAGAVYQFEDRNGQILYGFNIYDSPDHVVNPAEVKAVYDILAGAIRLRPLAYSPISPREIQQARQWTDPGFPVYLPEGIVEPGYESYSPGTAYGRVRRFTLAALETAVQQGRLSWQDIVVVDAAPTDIETVVAGVITGTRQGELSHINVRCLRRGTPNAYIQNPLPVFASYEGQLIKLEVSSDAYQIVYPVDVEEAEAWWKAHRPQIPPLPLPDDTDSTLLSLPDMAKSLNGDALVRRYGGKASQLGILYSVMAPRYEGQPDIPILVDGFAIPFYYYTEFMRSNYIPNPHVPNAMVTLEEYILGLLEDPQFRSDSEFRRRSLEDFMEYIEDYGIVPNAWIEAIIAKIEEVFGSDSVKVRFRSSSNAEDDVAFNGAGLYDSTSVCVADNLDGDDYGPSLCDPTAKKERTVERGLKRVWASLWNPRAFEEREYYQIEHRNTRMGVLVTLAYPSEDSNGVAFTGDPATGRKDYLVINVQQGDESVVQPGTGIIPEKDIVYLEYGWPSRIQRARPSSLMPAGEWILSEEQLYELSSLMVEIDQNMPVKTGEYTRDQIVFDMEFKYDQGQLVIKQIRPTLMATAVNPPVFPSEVILRIPEKTTLVKQFEVGRTIEEEYQLLSRIQFKAGKYLLPVQAGEHELEIVEELEFGPRRIVAVPLAPGIVRVEAFTRPQNGVLLRYEFEEKFRVQDRPEKTLILTIQGLQILNENKQQYTVELDTVVLSYDLFTQLQCEENGEIKNIAYGPAIDLSAQVYLHEAVLEGNQTIKFYELIKRRTQGIGIAYANFVFADMELNEGSFQPKDYWRLAYSAMGHCWNAKFWALLDQPVGDVYGVALLTTTIQWGASTEAEVFLLDKDLKPLRKVEIISYSKQEIEELPDPITAVPEWDFY
ncbi:MAG: PEP/pyruvate-binding domain-containing protein [bacterium]